MQRIMQKMSAPAYGIAPLDLRIQIYTGFRGVSFFCGWIIFLLQIWYICTIDSCDLYTDILVSLIHKPTFATIATIYQLIEAEWRIYASVN